MNKKVKTQKKLLKKFLVTTTIIATFCGYLENTKAKIDTATTANFASLQWVLGELMTSPPIGFPTPAANSLELVRSNVELANLLAQAVVSPLTAIARNGAGPIGAAAAAASTTALVAGPPAPGAASGAAGVVVANVGAVNLPVCQQEFIACATLILATAKAVCSVGIGTPGLTPAAINAAAAVSVAVAGGTLGGNFRIAAGAPHLVAVSARELVRAYVGVEGNMAALPPNAAALQAVFGGGAVDEAHALLCHLVERGHFWKHAVGLPHALSPERHFLAWARGARSGLDARVPPFHSAFVIPVASAHRAVAAGTAHLPAGDMKNAVTHLHTLLAAANAAYPIPGANTCLSWNGNHQNATDPTMALPAPHATLTALPAPQGTVGIHLNVVAGGGAGTMIKCNLTAGDNLAANLVRSPTAGGTPVQQQMAEAATALGEAATTAELLGRLPVGKTNGAYLVPLGVIPAIAATPTANVATNRISFLVNRNGTGTMFAE